MLNHKPFERKASLETEVVGYWAQEVWSHNTIPIPQFTKQNGIIHYRFATYSDGVNQELKYALKLLFSQKQWESHKSVQHALHTFIKCFNETTQGVHSLMQNPLSFWEIKLKSYLAEHELLAGDVSVYTNSLISKIIRIWLVVVDYYDMREEWDKEVIDARRVGLSIPVGTSGYRLNLSNLTPPWLRQATRDCLRYHANRSYGTLAHFLHNQKQFSRYLVGHFPEIQAEQLSRRVITGFIVDLHKRLKPSTVARTLSDLKLFLETCAIHGFASIPNNTLIFKEDFPKRVRPKPKFLPPEVLQQILVNLDRLSEPYRTMVAILEQTGCCVGEVLGLTLDCLSTDTACDYFLKRWINKQNKFHSIPITKALALLIQAQAQHIRDEFGNQAHYLFLNQKGQTIKCVTFEKAFKKWAVQSDIRDKAGQLYVPHFHQFRHTVGTRLLNNGMSQYLVQQFLGHESPDMTAVYAHLHDETAKQALNTFLTQQDSQLQPEQLIDATDKVVNLDDLWLKQNLKAQALPNGICALPVMLGECPHANACLDCQHFCTSRAFLPVHQKQLATSEQAEAKALEAGKALQAEMAKATNAKLQTLINQLENNNVNSTDPSQPTTDHAGSDERD